MPIHFGTDGWRAVISDTFTFNNLRLVAQAIADALSSELRNTRPLAEQEKRKREVVVGFDTRFLSDRYALDVARVLAANGFSVHLAQADSPTPAISYAVRHLNATAGVMITASHNAPRYNGIKLKANYGGSASREQCRRVEIYLTDNEERGRGPNLMEYETAMQQGLIERFDPIPAYHAHLKGLIDFDAIAKGSLQVVVDSMYGSGRGVIRRVLGDLPGMLEIRSHMNPGFGGIHPEPIGRYLDDLQEAIQASPGHFGVVTDGDADRIGAMDEEGTFVDPHKIMALSLRHLVEKRGLSGMVVRTVSTTRMVDRLAAKHRLPVRETPVGFNHIADLMLNEDVLIGGEESGGISFKGHIPEGDGILMGLLLLEIMATSGGSLHELVEDLLKQVGPAHYSRTDLRLKRPIEKERMMARLEENVPASIGGEGVAQVSMLDGAKYVLNDDSWLLIRPSGTEPVLRVYAEGRSPDMVKALLAYGETIAKSAA